MLRCYALAVISNMILCLPDCPQSPKGKVAVVTVRAVVMVCKAGTTTAAEKWANMTTNNNNDGGDGDGDGKGSNSNNSRDDNHDDSNCKVKTTDHYHRACHLAEN